MTAMPQYLIAANEFCNGILFTNAIFQQLLFSWFPASFPCSAASVFFQYHNPALLTYGLKETAPTITHTSHKVMPSHYIAPIIGILSVQRQNPTADSGMIYRYHRRAARFFLNSASQMTRRYFSLIPTRDTPS